MGVAPMLWLHSIDPATAAALKQFSGANEAPTPVVIHSTQIPRPPLAANVAPNQAGVVGR